MASRSGGKRPGYPVEVPCMSAARQRLERLAKRLASADERHDARREAALEAEFAHLNDEQLEAFANAERPELATTFRERGDPCQWPEFALMCSTEREVACDLYREFLENPLTFALP